MDHTQFLEMLMFCRPAGNPYEEAFINRYITPLGPRVDGFGNQIIDVGSKPNILWSSHTDTVHDRGGLQELAVNKKLGVVALPKKSKSSCLGADCTTGVYIMIKMIEAGVEGRYVFHRAEEEGALGSKYIAKNTPDLLKGIDAAVAFDRMGTDEIITHQGSSRTASQAFAYSFEAALGLSYYPSSFGSFTDTKSYAHLIPECTNIGVGYHHQHTPRETQSLTHLAKLVDHMVRFDTSGLVISRTPASPSFGHGYPGYWDEPETVYDLVYRYPKLVADYLTSMGHDFDSLNERLDAVFDEVKTTKKRKKVRVGAH